VDHYKYDLMVYVQGGSESPYFSASSNRLTVYNEKILGQLVLKKDFAGDLSADTFTGAIKLTISGPDGYSKVEYLSKANNWTHTLNNLALGAYTIEEDASLAAQNGYELSAAYTGSVTISEDDLVAGYSYSNPIAEESVTITNTYTKVYTDDQINGAELLIKKLRTGSSETLQGAVFTLYGPNGTSAGTSTSNGIGLAGFGGLNEAGTWKLVETAAPATYAANVGSYSIEVVESVREDLIQKDGKYVWQKTYTYTIASITDPNGVKLSADGSSGNPILVYNTKAVGELTIAKRFSVDSALEDVAVVVDVAGPNGYAKEVTLDAENDWTVTLDNLAFGEYTVTEDKEANSVDGYELYIQSNPANGKVHLNAEHYASTISFINTYADKELTLGEVVIRKIDSVTEEPLEGVVFGLYRKSDGELLTTAVTDENGVVRFTGFWKEATYILKEEATLPYYVAPAETSWTINVTHAIEKETDEAGNQIDHHIYTAAFEDESSELVVENTRKLGKLTVAKTVEYWMGDVQIESSLDNRKGASYNFKVTIGDETETITLKAGETKEYTDIPYGTAYSVEEIIPANAAYVETLPENAEGIIEQEAETVEVINKYFYQTINYGLRLIKVDDETDEPIQGAEFTLYGDAACSKVVSTGTSDKGGNITLSIPTHGTYYLKETKAPAGYHRDYTVYTVTAGIQYEVVRDEYGPMIYVHTFVRVADLAAAAGEDDVHFTYVVENTAVKKVPLTVKKVWDDGGYLAGRPGSIAVTLFRDGEAYHTVSLNARNNWTFSWNNLTDEHDWSVDETRVPANYEKTIEQDGETWIITNTRLNVGDLTIEKHFGVGTAYKPASVTLKLVHPDGKSEDIVLNEGNGWKVTLNNVPLGVYTVTEDKAANGAEGYELLITSSAADGKVSLSRDNFAAAVVITNTYVGLDSVPGSARIKKVDGDTGEALAGVTFGLYDADGEKIGEAITNKEGLALFQGFAEEAEYTIKEEAALADYVKSDAVYPLTITSETIQEKDENGKLIDRTYYFASFGDAEGTLTVKNYKKTGSLTIVKKVEYHVNDSWTANAALDGRDETFTFKVTIGDKTESVALKGGQSKTFSDIPYGTAYSVEEVIPENAAFESILPENAKGVIADTAVEVTAVNSYRFLQVPGAVSLLKVDAETGKAIEGAEFTLYQNGKAVATATSGADGKIELPLSGLTDYTLKETKAPEGYLANDAEYSFSTEVKFVEGKDEDGRKVIYMYLIASTEALEAQETEGELQLTYIVPNTKEPEVGSLVISKTVKGSGASTTQAFTFTLTLTDANGEAKYTKGAENGTFDAAKPFTFTLAHGQTLKVEGLPAGVSYTVVETASTGYTAESVNAFGKITKDAGIAVSFVNTYTEDDDTVDIPKTGDSANAAAAPVLSGLAVMWLAVILFVLKRKQVI